MLVANENLEMSRKNKKWAGISSTFPPQFPTLIRHFRPISYFSFAVWRLMVFWIEDMSIQKETKLFKINPAHIKIPLHFTIEMLLIAFQNSNFFLSRFPLHDILRCRDREMCHYLPLCY
jgi:hypothetical protein